MLKVQKSYTKSRKQKLKDQEAPQTSKLGWHFHSALIISYKLMSVLSEPRLTNNLYKGKYKKSQPL